MAVLSSFSQPNANVGDTYGEYIVREVINARRGRYRWEKFKDATSIVSTLHSGPNVLGVRTSVIIPTGKVVKNVITELEVIDPGHANNGRRITLTSNAYNGLITKLVDTGGSVPSRLTVTQIDGRMDDWQFTASRDNFFELYDATIEVTVTIIWGDDTNHRVMTYRGNVSGVRPIDLGRISFTVRTMATDEVVTIPVSGDGLDYCADWGDGSFRAGSTKANPTHTYTNPGYYRVNLVCKKCPKLVFENAASAGNVSSIDEIYRPSLMGMTDMDKMWSGCVNATVSNATIDLTGVETARMFMQGVAVDTSSVSFIIPDVCDAGLAFNGSESLFSRAVIDSRFAILIDDDHRLKHIVAGPRIIDHSKALSLIKINSPYDIDTSGIMVQSPIKYESLFTDLDLDWWRHRTGGNVTEPSTVPPTVDHSGTELDSVSIEIAVVTEKKKLNYWWDHNQGVPVGDNRYIGLSATSLGLAMSTLVGAEISGTDAAIVGTKDETIVIQSENVSATREMIAQYHRSMMEQWDVLLEKINSIKTISDIQNVSI